MVYTVTLNPSLNRTVEVEELVYDDVNQVVESSEFAGGKGIDVSRVIKELGGQSIALGFAGGYNGLQLEGKLINEGLICDFTKVNDETKSNFILYQRKKKVETLLATSGPRLTPLEIATLHNKVKDLPGGSYVVVSGGIPEGIDDSFFAQLITALKQKNIKVILDTDGDPLKKGVIAGPYLVKPNNYELGRLVEKNVMEIGDVLDHAKPLLDSIDYVAVSMGGRGVLGISRDGVYHATPPEVKVRSSIGAGDSLVAGMVFVLSNGGSFQDALALGVACGTATTLNPGNDLCKNEDVSIIRKDVIVKEI